MSTKTNDPKQTAPETEPVVDDIKTEPVTPDAEEKADKKTAQKAVSYTHLTLPTN